MLFVEATLTDAQVRELLRQGMEQTGPRVAMAAFARGDIADSVYNDGTASLLHLPDSKLKITNHHVWDHFREGRANDPDYRVALTGQGVCRPIDLSAAEVISENEQHDLLSFSHISKSVSRIPPTIRQGTKEIIDEKKKANTLMVGRRLLKNSSSA